MTLRRPKLSVAWMIGCAIGCSLVPLNALAQRPPAIRMPRGRQLAQFKLQVQGGIGNSDESTDANFVQPQRERLQILTRAGKLLQDKRYGEAVRDLGSILEGQEDGVLPRQGDEPIRFLKAEALKLLASIPQEGRDSYELQFGAQAQQLLDDAVAAGDVTGLEEVARRFFHTKAGYAAIHLLGCYHFDRGRILAAALCFQRLADTPAAAEPYQPALSLQLAACWLWSGLPEKSKQTLLDLKQRHPDAPMEIGGKPVKWFQNDADALAWLSQTVGAEQRQQTAQTERWTMFRGNAERNAASGGGRPLLTYRWRVPGASDPYVMDLLDQIRSAYREQNVAALPALHPLAVNDVILMRTTHNLLAVDFNTGKRIWEVPSDDTIENLPGLGGNGAPNPGAWAASGLDQRLWEDLAFGAISSDGQNVYTIEDLSVRPSNMNQPTMRIMFNGRGRVFDGGRNYNRLAAHELRTEGKLKWSLGGPPGDDELEESGTFFLGAPLPLAGRLYSLAETKGEIRLLSVNPSRDPHRGEKLVEWSQPLAMVELNVFENSMRRLAGVTPSYADGVMVCPTSAGVIVALELTTRSLLWGYSYQGMPQGDWARIQAMRMGFMQSNDGLPETDRWHDASLTVADGRVLVTPVESNEIHCLNLMDGKLLWKKPREDGLYLACVHDGIVLLVGRTSVRALRLANGEPAWAEASLALPSGSSPSGRGFLNDGHYYLPLTSAEVAAVDIAAGKFVGSARSRMGYVPGNLVCYKGAVISQGVDYLDCFYQASELERQVADALKQNPDDPSALASSGEILLDKGQLSDAVAQLQRAFDLRPEPHTRELLVESLLEILRTDFAANRERTAQLEQLIALPEQREAYLRMLAGALQQAGETLPALDAYLKLADLESGQSLARVDLSLTVRRDRWVQAGLAALRGAATPDNAAKMDELLQGRFQASLASEKPAELRQLLDYFGQNPAADDVRLRLAELLGEGDALEAELLLRRVALSDVPARAAAADGRLALLLQHLQATNQAASVFRRLREKWADVPCRDGKTGRQMADEIPADDPVAARLSAEDPWPVGVVDVKKSTRPGPSYRTFSVDLSETSEADMPDASIELDPQRQLMIGRDGIGRQRWQVSVAEQGQPNNWMFNPGFNRARVHGNLVVVSLGYQVLAIDTLGGEGKGPARVLWKEDLSGSLPGNGNQFNLHQMRVNAPWGGGQKFFMGDMNGKRIGAIGPIGSEYVCLQRGRSLLALDPLSGKPLWVRQGIDSSSELFGDDEVLLAAPSDNSPAQVLRAMDGAELGRSPVPPAHERVTTIGRKVLAWTMQGGKVVLKLVDPWKGQELWQKPFDMEAKAALIGLEAIGVLEKSGQFTVLNLADGGTLMQSKVRPEPSLSEIYVMAIRDRYILIANTPQTPDPKIAGVQPIPGNTVNNPIINGHIYGFERATGNQVWSHGVKNQALMLEQPSETPALVFACHIYKRGADGNNFVTLASVLCLDKRSGRVLYEDKESPTAISHYELQADSQKKTVELRMMQEVITMTFTGQPLPPEQEAKEKEAEKAAEEGGEKEAEAESEKPEPKEGDQSQTEPRGSLPAETAKAIFRGLRKWAENRAAERRATKQEGAPPPADNERKPAHDDPEEAEGEEAEAEEAAESEDGKAAPDDEAPADPPEAEPEESNE